VSLASLFPQLTGLRLEQVALDGESVTLHLAASTRFARCPLCTRRSKRAHSSYHRTVADLPLAGRQLILRLQVRRFRCGARRCPRAIFAERFPKLVAAYGRRTLGQRRALEVIAFALGGPPERQRPQRSTHRVLAPYELYLIQRWAEGCRNRARLFREIRRLGYHHSARTVSLFLKRLHNEQPSTSTAAPPRQTMTRVPSARHVASLLVWRKERLPEEERNYLRRLCDQEPTIARAYELAQEFAAMARERTGQELDAWLTRATTSEITELDRFARGLTDERAAVEAGLCQEWSNGQTEGQVNKLKLLKRQMYGRYVIWNLAPRDGATGTRCLSLSRTGRAQSWKALQRRRSPRDGRSWPGVRMA
jgi:transposase